jgi:transcription factor CP2-like protein
VPLSYGAFDIVQPANALNIIHFNWDPTKEVGVYIKVSWSKNKSD